MSDQILFIQNNNIIPFTENDLIFCNSIERGAPSLDVKYIEHEGADGSGDSRARYKSFEITATVTLFHGNRHDKELKQQDMYSKLYPRASFYLVYDKAPGKKFKVRTTDCNQNETHNTHTEYSITFEVFEGCAESIGSTQNDRTIDFETWQVQQGLFAEDYEYSFKRSRFKVYNLGDFTVDPRVHYLKIKLTGDSDGGVEIYNKTTRERFIYNKAISKNKSEEIEINGVKTYRNGVMSGIDTNGQLITLAPGENEIEINNVSAVNVTFDFNFRYK